MSVTLYLILGLVFGAAVFYAATKMTLAWYEWLLVALGIIFFVFAVQNFQYMKVEYETRAATTLLFMFGLPGLILLGLGFYLPMQRAKK